MHSSILWECSNSCQELDTPCKCTTNYRSIDQLLMERLCTVQLNKPNEPQHAQSRDDYNVVCVCLDAQKKTMIQVMSSTTSSSLFHLFVAASTRAFAASSG